MKHEKYASISTIIYPHIMRGKFGRGPTVASEKNRGEGGQTDTHKKGRCSFRRKQFNHAVEHTGRSQKKLAPYLLCSDSAIPSHELGTSALDNLRRSVCLISQNIGF